MNKYQAAIDTLNIRIEQLREILKTKDNERYKLKNVKTFLKQHQQAIALLEKEGK